MIHRFSRTGRRSGATLVEGAVCLGAILFFLFAIFEYGRFVMLRHLLDNAAREGARQAVADTNNSLATADIQATVNGFLAGQTINISSFSVYKADPTTGANIGAWTSAGFGDSIAVDVQGSYTPMLPTFGFLPNPVSMRAKVVMQNEGNN
jgi:Flp pilus assembly protein TadG